MKLLMESWRQYLNEIYISRDCKKKTGETGHCAVLNPSTKKQMSCYDDCGTAKRAHKGEIKEVEDFPDYANSQEEIQKSLNYYYGVHAPGKGTRKELGKWKGPKAKEEYDLVMYDLSPDRLYFLVSNDEPKAYVATSPFEDGWAVGNVLNDADDFKISEFYEYLIQQLGTLYSDKAQTAAGRKIWKHIPHEEVPTDCRGTRLKATK